MKHLLTILYHFVLLWLIFAMPAKADQLSLQEQIDGTPAGSVLELEDGVYTGQITITKPITLRGSKHTMLEGSGKEPLLKIENVQNVTLENIHITDAHVGIVVKNTSQVNLNNVQLRNVWSGVQIYNSKHVVVNNLKIKGINGHYSKKGNGLDVFNSNDLTISNNKVQDVQDGFYIEKAQAIKLTDNAIKNSRYGIHFMYTEDAIAEQNDFNQNVTGIMLMMTEDTQLQNNHVTEQNGLNGSGMVLFEAKNIDVLSNHFQNNRTALSTQKLTTSTVEYNTFQMNQTAIELLRSNKENTVYANDFVGNIVNLRSDGTSSSISHNYYDDYDGIDIDDNGIGDSPYVALQSFGQWMVRKPSYQYFIESPSVVLLNKMDRQTNAIETELLVDKEPMMHSAQKATTAGNIQLWQVVTGLAGLVLGLWLWRKEASV
ncbi:right-handed parallel beta-helix repeat-containing protein [Viridibacillus sp. NPDC093762]|uniref:right-handed parallel beta-helix repeat-containing protein n=1 Tax=Viridibacillus sp. NPDC093762 TaxID=3390720 RepID=UPI003D02563B